MQKKRKSVRDYYTREKKRENEDKKTGSAASKKKKTPYFDVLSFLEVSKLPRPSSGSVSAATEDAIQGSSEDILTDENSESQFENENYNLNASPASQTSTAQTVPVKSAKKRKLTPFQASLLKYMENTPKTPAVDDPNKNCLLSFVPEMEKMTERQNFEFRMAIMNALNKIKYQIPLHRDTDGQWNASSYDSSTGSFNSYTSDQGISQSVTLHSTAAQIPHSAMFLPPDNDHLFH